MIDLIESDEYAVVGVLIDRTVIYNIIERETEFIHTGLSIINYLKHDKNKFVSDIINSQSYESIKYVFDDRMLFNNILDAENTNIERYNAIQENLKNEFNVIYIYDYLNDLLITTHDKKYIAIDYKNQSDVRNFINKLKRK